MSRDGSGQAPWRSYSGLASPAPRTCPRWRFASMLGRRPVPLPRPASAEMASQRPGRAPDAFHGSLGLAQLDLPCRTLKRQDRKGEGKEESGGGREEGEEEGREAKAPGCCAGRTGAARARAGTRGPRLPASRGCGRAVKMPSQGGDRASPWNLNLRDKTLAFSRKKSHGAVASSPIF